MYDLVAVTKKKGGKQIMYKTEFIKSDLDNKQLSPDAKCVLSISLELQKPDTITREGDKLISTLHLINKNFKECTIVLGEALQRYNYIFSGSHSLHDYTKLCYKYGDQWLKNYNSCIAKELKIPFKIIRWDYFMTHPKFQESLKRIEVLYKTDDTYKQAFNETIENFLDRRKKHHHGKNLSDKEVKIWFQTCLDYLKEEIASFCLYPEFGCQYEIYRTKRTPILRLVYEDLLKKESPNLLQPISLRFKKIKDHIPAEEVSETLTLKNLLEILPGHIYWKNRDGIYLGCNLQQANYYGLNSAEKILNRTDFDVLPESVAKKIRHNDLKIMKEGITSVFEESNKGDYFLSSKSPIKNDLGENIGVIGCSVNITKQKSLEQKLKVQTNVLSETVRTKDRFLNNLSHEIRTPIHIMSSIIEELHNHYYHLSDAEKTDFIKLLHTSVKKISKLATNMLLLAKKKKGILALHLENINLTQLVQSVVDELSVIAKSTITIISPNPVYAECTKYQIEQVARNLIENAIKYGRDKPIKIVITHNATQAVVEVIDNGIAIPKDELIKIFEAFEEGSRTKSLSGGTGLGLAISKDIINLHQGKIWVESEDGVGSKFTFIIPIKSKLKFKQENHEETENIICG